MTIEELNSRIAVVNAESNRINNERRVNIGKKETLTEQLNNAIAQYNKTYGTNIDISTLEAEISRVCALKEQEVTSIENMLQLIKEGKFDEATKVTDGVETPVEVAQPVVTPTVETVQETPIQPVAPVIETPVPAPISTPQPVVEQPVVPNLTTPSMPTPPSVPNFGVPTPPTTPNLGIPTPPVTPVAPTQPSLSGLDMPTPPSLSGLDVPPVAPPPASKPTNFNAILGGSAFNPQQN